MLRKNAGARATYKSRFLCGASVLYLSFLLFSTCFPQPPAKWHKTYFQHLLTSRMYHPPHLFPFFANHHSSTLPMYLTSWLFPLFHRNQETIRAQQHSQVVWVPPVECLSLPSSKSAHSIPVRRRNSSPWSKIAEIAAHGATYYTTETKVRRMQSMCTELQLLSLFSKHIYLTVQKVFSNVLNSKTLYFLFKKFVACLITWVL